MAPMEFYSSYFYLMKWAIFLYTNGKICTHFVKLDREQFMVLSLKMCVLATSILIQCMKKKKEQKQKSYSNPFHFSIE